MLSLKKDDYFKISKYEIMYKYIKSFKMYLLL